MASNFKTYTYDLLLNLVNILHYLTFSDQNTRNVETEYISETFSNTKLDFPPRRRKGSWWRVIKKCFQSYVLDFILFTTVERLSSENM